MEAFENSDGSITVNVNDLNPPSMLQTGLPIGTWLHLGISLASNSQVVVSVVTWAGVQSITRSTQWTGSHQSEAIWLIPKHVNLGGLSPVADSMEMVDARWYSVGLTETDFMAAAGAGNCPIDCNGICSGPSFNSCDFISLVDKDITVTRNAEVGTYISLPPRLDASYSFTAWFYSTETSSTASRLLIRVTNSANDCCSLGDRVLFVALLQSTTPHTLAFRFDTTALPNFTINNSLPVRFT